MVRSCSAIDCTFRHCKNSEVKLRSFLKDPKRRALWSKSTKRIDPHTGKQWIPGQGASLCSAHFEKNCFDTNTGKLLPDALPTLFSFTSSSSQRLTKVAAQARQPLPPISTQPGLELPSTDTFRHIRLVITSAFAILLCYNTIVW